VGTQFRERLLFSMCRSTGMCLMVKDMDVPLHFNYFGTMENDTAEEHMCKGQTAHITF